LVWSFSAGGGDFVDHWRFYRTPAGAKVVEDALKLLGREQIAALNDLRKRFTSGRLLPREVETVGNGLLALRTTVGGMELRMYFGRVGKGGCICLAVHVLNKKSKKVPKKDMKLARDRLREWQTRHAPPGTTR
jgi:phage-related protein